MTPNDLNNLVAFDHAARALAGLIGLAALLALWFLYLLPIGTCDRCDHCRVERERKRDEQQRLAREYADRMGLAETRNPSGQPGERPRDVPGVVVPDGAADQAARPVEVESEDPPGDALP